MIGSGSRVHRMAMSRIEQPGGRRVAAHRGSTFEVCETEQSDLVAPSTMLCLRKNVATRAEAQCRSETAIELDSGRTENASCCIASAFRHSAHDCGKEPTRTRPHAPHLLAFTKKAVR